MSTWALFNCIFNLQSKIFEVPVFNQNRFWRWGGGVVFTKMNFVIKITQVFLLNILVFQLVEQLQQGNQLPGHGAQVPYPSHGDCQAAGIAEKSQREGQEQKVQRGNSRRGGEHHKEHYKK